MCHILPFNTRLTSSQASIISLIILGICGSVYSRDLLSRENEKLCVRGQVYWCQNITTAVRCGAMKHCIQSVWEKEVPIEVDHSEVCQVCLDMVKQARDQLESNETQEEIKEVLEGSCRLIPIKIVNEECIKFMDEFAPQLIDTLASQMNPQVVCSVAGLCNNNRVHQLEAEYHRREGSTVALDCQNCNGIVHLIKQKFNKMSEKEFLGILLNMCSKAGSFSDGCMDIVLKEHGNLLSWLQNRVNPRPVCNLVNICHVNERRPAIIRIGLKKDSSSVTTVTPLKNDLPCDLCIQLVQHLRDILISNTTEVDFKQVLEGICNQWTSYKDECLTIVDQYYDVIYEFLTSELDGQVICKEINICPGKEEIHKTFKPLSLSEDVPKTFDPASVQLPLSRMDPFTFIPSTFVSNQQNERDPALCSMCEYFLHFLQQEITLPSNEKKIRDVVLKGCSKLPSSVADECQQFVNTYMDNIIALLAQEIDPSQVCPMLGICPGSLLIAVPYKDEANCPLCLLAMQEINTKVSRNNRTAKHIEDIVDDLCLRDQFPESISIECVQFVTHYKSSIVDMVLTEFSAQESCAFISLCIPHETRNDVSLPVGDIKTNEIRQNSNVEGPNTCVLCEFIMTKIEQLLKNRTTEEEIKDAVLKVCDYLPKTVTPQCKQFVSQYAELIIELLAQEISPKEVCIALNLCGNASSLIKGDIGRCLVCEVLMDGLKTVVTDETIDDDINKQLEKACGFVTQRERSLCLSMVEQLAPQIEMALRTLPIGPLVCRRIHVCEDRVHSKNISAGSCRFGSSYWCQSSITAAQCNAIEFCQKEVWKGNKPRKSHNKGRVVIGY